MWSNALSIRVWLGSNLLIFRLLKSKSEFDFWAFEFNEKINGFWEAKSKWKSKKIKKNKKNGKQKWTRHMVELCMDKTKVDKNGNQFFSCLSYASCGFFEPPWPKDSLFQSYKKPFPKLPIMLVLFPVSLPKAPWPFPKGLLYPGFSTLVVPHSSWMFLVRHRCSKILYFGATFRDSLVADTPMETEDVNLATWPTKSSALKHQWYFGFRCLEFQTRWIKLWCFGTIWKLILSFSKDHLLSHSYLFRKSSVRSSDCWYSAGVGIIPAVSQSCTSFSKLVAAVSICCSHCSSVPAKIFCRTGIIAGNRCLASAALISKLACFFQGFCASVSMDNLKFVNLFLHSCFVYSTWICVKRIESLSQGFLACLCPGPSW